MTAALQEAGELSVTEVRKNGLRVDARFRAGTGDRWLVVIWFSDESLDGVESVTVYPRPKPFDGSIGGLVIVVNGPSSVGKSALMRAFVNQAQTPFAAFDEPFLGALRPDFLAWPDTLGRHGDGVLRAIAASAELGNQFIVSAAGIAQPRIRSALEAVETLYVGLNAPLAVLVERQLTQADKFGGLAEESINIHEGWKYDLRIDTERCSPDVAARTLSEFIEQRYNRTP